jgi:hypothetical protein
MAALQVSAARITVDPIQEKAMNRLLVLFITIACAASTARAQPAAGTTVRDRLWLFGCPPNADAGYLENAGYRGGSRMTPVEGAVWLGIPNMLFITQDWNRPKGLWYEETWKAKTELEQWAIAFEPMQRVNWSAVGSSGSGGLRTVPDIVTVAKKYPNITGIYLDDFVKDAVKRPDGRKVGKPVPLDLMEHQCGLGLKWLKEGRVGELVILSNTHLDLGIDTAPWMRAWIKKHGDEKLPR